MSQGKGSRQRPSDIPKAEYDRRWEQTFLTNGWSVEIARAMDDVSVTYMTLQTTTQNSGVSQG